MLCQGCVFGKHSLVDLLNDLRKKAQAGSVCGGVYSIYTLQITSFGPFWTNKTIHVSFSLMFSTLPAVFLFPPELILCRPPLPLPSCTTLLQRERERKARLLSVGHRVCAINSHHKPRGVASSLWGSMHQDGSVFCQFLYHYINKDGWSTYCWTSICLLSGYWFTLWFLCCCFYSCIFIIAVLPKHGCREGCEKWGWMCYHSNKLTHWQDCTILLSHRVSAADVANGMCWFPAFVDAGRGDPPCPGKRCPSIRRLGRVMIGKDDDGLLHTLFIV